MDRHGFIRTELELKTLILYVLNRAGLPVPFSELTDMVLCDGAIGYFEYASALSDLAASGHVTCEGTEQSETYSIADKGLRDLATCEGSLPATARRRADEAVARLLPALQRYHQVETSVVMKGVDRLSAVCRLKDDAGEVFKFELTVPNQEQATAVIDNFRAHAEEVYNAFLTLLLDFDE